MRKIWLGIVGAVFCLGLGLTVVGCSKSASADKNKMTDNKMTENKMTDNKTTDNKRTDNKTTDNKMADNKMTGDKTDKK